MKKQSKLDNTINQLGKIQNSKQPLYRKNIVAQLRRIGFGNATIAKQAGITISELKALTKPDVSGQDRTNLNKKLSRMVAIVVEIGKTYKGSDFWNSLKFHQTRETKPRGKKLMAV